MAGKYRVIHTFPNPLSTQQDITIDGFGPVAGATFKWVLSNLDGTNRDDMGAGMGAVSFAGSGFQWACSSFSEDNVDPSVCSSMGSVVAAIQISNDDGTGAVLTGTVTSLAEGIRITWDVTPTTAWRLEVTLYGGDTMQCEAGAEIDDTTVVGFANGTVLTEMTIEPEVILFASPNGNAFATPSADAFFSMGMGNQALEQGSWGYADEDGRTGANRHGHRLSATRVIEIPDWAAAGTPLVSLELTATGVNGTPRGTFGVTKRDTSQTLSWGWFAFSTDGVQSSKIEAVLVDTNAAGAKSYTGSGFEPMFATLLHTNLPSLGGNNGNNAGGGPGSSSVDDKGLSEGSYSVGSQEVDPSNTYSAFGAHLALQRTNTGSDSYQLSLDGFTTTGFDFTVDDASSVDKQIIILTLEVEPWGGIFWENICTEFDHVRTAGEITNAKIWSSDYVTSTEGQTQEGGRTVEAIDSNDQELFDLIHEFDEKVQDEDWLAARVAFYQIRDLA